MPPKIELDRPLLLVAGLELPLGETDAFAWSAAGDVRSILAALRASRVDLLLAGASIAGSPFAPVMRQVKATHPRQRWALVAPDIDESAEIDARSLGALAIFDGPPSTAQLREMLQRIRARGQPVVTSTRIPHPRPPGEEEAPKSPGKSRSP